MTEPVSRPLIERLKGWLDSLLVIDVFVVIGGAIWFALALGLHGLKVEAPLELFQRLWTPVFTPAIGVLMAAAVLSGLLGWWQRRGPRQAPGSGS
jgi:TRAP-type C4-dicarboxylate transport system permease small subunit